MFIISVFSSCGGVRGDLISKSISPNGTHTVEAYRHDGGATTAFSVDVFLSGNYNKELIYSCYREDRADITWINDNVVEINGVRLDLSKNETYNWRDDPYYDSRH